MIYYFILYQIRRWYICWKISLKNRNFIKRRLIINNILLYISKFRILIFYDANNEKAKYFLSLPIIIIIINMNSLFIMRWDSFIYLFIFVLLLFFSIQMVKLRKEELIFSFFLSFFQTTTERSLLLFYFIINQNQLFIFFSLIIFWNAYFSQQKMYEYLYIFFFIFLMQRWNVTHYFNNLKGFFFFLCLLMGVKKIYKYIFVIVTYS